MKYMYRNCRRVARADIDASCAATINFLCGYRSIIVRPWVCGKVKIKVPGSPIF